MTIQEILRLQRPPVGIGLFSKRPQGIKKWAEEVPAGCVLWKRALEGLTFYTVPSDHLNCVIGCHTHRIELPVERKFETQNMIDLMIKNKYLLAQVIRAIPTLKVEPKNIAYGPAKQALFKPSVVNISVKPTQAMIIYEAAIRAGVGNAMMKISGRPRCGTIPLTLDANCATLSLGCKGNRVNTGLPDDERYISIPGDRWSDLSKAIVELHEANTKMESYFRERKVMIPVSN